MQALKKRLSYANVMATIAVFVALGGGAYAAIKIPKKSVGTKQLKANAVKTNKLAEGAVTASKIASGQVIKNVVVRETVVANVGNNASQIETITCQPGEKALAGGGGFTPLGTRNYSLTEIGTDTHLVSPVDANGDAIAGGLAPAGFLVSLLNDSGGARDYHGYVICGQL